MTFKIISKFCASPRRLDDAKTDFFRDDTEVTNGSDFDDCFNGLDGEMSKVTVGTSDTLEESLESSFMELQHEMREKSAQCAILRETLTTMSATMRRLEFQLKEKTSELEEKLNLYEQKTVECEHWKTLHKTLESRIENGMYNSAIQPVASTVEDYLLLAHYKYESYTNRRPWRSKKDGDCDNWDELSASSDSIDEEHGSDFDSYFCKPKKDFNSKRKIKNKQKTIKKPMEPKEHEITQETSEEPYKIGTQEQIPCTKTNLVAQGGVLSETNCTQKEPMPSDIKCTEAKQFPYDIEYFPSVLNNFEDEEENAIIGLLNSSWGNFEHCLSEEDPPHHSLCEHFIVARLPSSEYGQPSLNRQLKAIPFREA
jgi:hypothetical protein